MQKVAFGLVLVLAVLTAATREARCQQTSRVIEPELRGLWCCTVVGMNGMSFGPFCGVGQNPDQACMNARKKMADAGCTEVTSIEPFLEDDCQDPYCALSAFRPSPLMSPSTAMGAAPLPPTCTVYLKCYGCDGCCFLAHGTAFSWCEAYRKAQWTANAVGNALHGGLRCYCVCCPQQQHRHSGLLFRRCRGR